MGVVAMSLHRQWEGLLIGKAPDWQQVLPLGAEVKALTLAADGDVYLAGDFTGTLRLGSATLVSAGETDVFVTRFDQATGTFSWAQRAGGPGHDALSALAVSGGRVYLAGYVGATGPRPATVADFGPLRLPAQGTANMFVTQLTTDARQARFGWVQGMPGVRRSEAQLLAARDTSVYLAGTFEAHNGYFGITSHQPGASREPDTTKFHQAHFIARLGDRGAHGEMTSMIIIGFDRATSLTALVAGTYPDLYLAGNYEADPFTFIRTPHDKPGTGKPNHTEARIEKLADDGRRLQLLGRYTLGDSSETTINALVVKGKRLYAAGAFQQHTRFQDIGRGGPIDLFTPAQAGYLLCLTDTRDDDFRPQPEWAKALTSPPDRASRYQARVLALHDSTLYVAGSYEALQPDGTTYFSQHPTLAQQFARLADYHNPGIFISQVVDHGTAGQVRWEQRTTGDGMAFVRALAATAGPVYVAGHFVPRVQFGRFLLAAGTTPTKQLSTGFWARLGPGKSQHDQVVEVKY